MMQLYSVLVAVLTTFQILFISTGAALTPWNVSASTFAIAWHQTCVIVDNWLYIEGGEMYEVGASSRNDTRYPPTRSIDLSSSWNAASAVVYQIAKPSEISGTETYGRPGLFWQSSTKSFVMYSGRISSEESSFARPYTIWDFTPNKGDGKWTSTTATLNDITWPISPSIVDTPSGGFVTGGYSRGIRTFNPLLNMTIVGDHKTFTGAQSIGPFSIGGIEGGRAHFISSFGTGEGIIVYIGGATMRADFRKRSTTKRADLQYKLLSLSTIHMYDIASRSWYTQTAGGDVPAGRIGFCTTGAQETNTASYEIFVYGGTGINDGDFEPDAQYVYILSLPAFQWIRNPEYTPARAGHTCQMVKNQILNYGGWDPSAKNKKYSDNRWPQGLQVFDTTKSKWSGNYNASAAAYVRPELVSNYYSTNPSKENWDNSSVKALFSTPTLPTSSTSSTLPETSNSTSSSRTTQTKSKIRTGPIVGGTIGGVVFLAAACALVWAFVIHHKRKGNSSPMSYTPVQKSNFSELGPHQAHEIANSESVNPIFRAGHHPKPVELYGGS